MKEKQTILIVEDEAVLRDIYKLILSAQGYNVHTAANGAKGLLLLKETVPDLILLDLFMPVMDGKEFLKNFDSNDYPQTTIIVYSNLSDDHIEREMIALGASQVVLKSSMAPKDLVELVATSLKIQPPKTKNNKAKEK